MFSEFQFISSQLLLSSDFWTLAYKYWVFTFILHARGLLAFVASVAFATSTTFAAFFISHRFPANFALPGIAQDSSLSNVGLTGFEKDQTSIWMGSLLYYKWELLRKHRPFLVQKRTVGRKAPKLLNLHPEHAGQSWLSIREQGFYR